MPYLSILAVMLCTCMVLVVWSVMGGFLVMLLDLGRKMEGDVSITWPTIGFAHYEDLIKRVEADPMVEAAAPMIETFGMISLADDRAKGVMIRGIDSRYAKVSAYADALWWKPITSPMPKDTRGVDPRLEPNWAAITERAMLNAPLVESLYDKVPPGSYIPPRPGVFRDWKTLYEDGIRLEITDPASGVIKPAAVLGIEMATFSKRKPEGYYDPGTLIGTRRDDGRLSYHVGFTPATNITLNVLPMDKKGRNITMRSRQLPVANEFRTGFFEADKGQVLINLGELQEMLNMTEGVRLAPSDKSADPYAINIKDGKEQPAQAQVLRPDPARVTTILIKAKPGVDAEALRQRCTQIYSQFAKDHGGEVPSAEMMDNSRGVSTWARNQATFIGAVERETALVLFLLMGISFVAVFLILAIFWSMVSEKTKDIGVLRAVGAGRLGVAWLWLRYGLSIGVVGGLLGGVLAYTIVWNINPIHEWMGRALNLTIWDPNVYYFSEIPHDVVTWKAVLVVCGALVFSVLGALIPALRAAFMDPVRALRFE